MNTGIRPKVKSKRKCSLCEGDHLWIYCKTYGTREKKIEILKKFKLCFVCGSDKHLSTDCGRLACEQGCNYKHHLVICPRYGKTNQSKQEKQKGKKTSVQVSTATLSNEVVKTEGCEKSILPTATISLKGKWGRVVHERGLLDPCAERTFIKRSALDNLHYQRKGSEKMSLQGYLTATLAQEYEIVTIYIPYKG